MVLVKIVSPFKERNKMKKYLSKLPAAVTLAIGAWAYYGGFETQGLLWFILAQLVLIEQAIKAGNATKDDD